MIQLNLSLMIILLSDGNYQMGNWREKSLLLTKCYDPFDVLFPNIF